MIKRVLGLGLLMLVSAAPWARAQEPLHRQVPGESLPLQSRMQLVRWLFDETQGPWDAWPAPARQDFAQHISFGPQGALTVPWERVPSAMGLAFTLRLAALLQVPLTAQQRQHPARRHALDQALHCQQAGADACASVSDAALAEAFESEVKRSYGLADLGASARLEALGQLLEARASLTCDQRRLWIQTQGEQGDWGRAQALAAQGGCFSMAWPAVPVKPKGPAVMLVTDEGRKAQWLPVEVSRYTGVLVASSPACPFSERATAALRGAPDLNALMGQHALWVGTDVAPQAYAQWNARNAPQRLAFLSDFRGWPFSGRVWQTPVFLFLKEGQVVSQKVGWHRDDDNLGEVRRALRQIGLRPNP